MDAKTVAYSFLSMCPKNFKLTILTSWISSRRWAILDDTSGLLRHVLTRLFCSFVFFKKIPPSLRTAVFIFFQNKPSVMINLQTTCNNLECDKSNLPKMKNAAKSVLFSHDGYSVFNNNSLDTALRISLASTATRGAARNLAQLSTKSLKNFREMRCFHQCSTILSTHQHQSILQTTALRIRSVPKSLERMVSKFAPIRKRPHNWWQNKIVFSAASVTPSTLYVRTSSKRCGVKIDRCRVHKHALALSRVVANFARFRVHCHGARHHLLVLAVRHCCKNGVFQACVSRQQPPIPACTQLGHSPAVNTARKMRSELALVSHASKAAARDWPRARATKPLSKSSASSCCRTP